MKNYFNKSKKKPYKACLLDTAQENILIMGGKSIIQSPCIGNVIQEVFNNKVNLLSFPLHLYYNKLVRQNPQLSVDSLSIYQSMR